MPPKKPAADSADPPAPTSSDAPVEEKKSDAATLRKPATHPSTAIMVKEALKELDSRKGASSQAIQSYIKQKYPSVDLVRLKTFVRKALKKGLESGTLVRPANANATAGATGSFRLAPKVKEAKPKTENADPNVQKAAAKDGAKKPKKAGATKKKKGTANEEVESKEEEEPKPPKKSKKEKENAAPEATASKVAPAKKPKAKKAAVEEEGDDADDKGASEPPAKTKAAKTTKETKAGKPSRSKAAKAGSKAPAAKATGKRGKKTAE